MTKNLNDSQFHSLSVKNSCNWDLRCVCVNEMRSWHKFTPDSKVNKERDVSTQARFRRGQIKWSHLLCGAIAQNYSGTGNLDSLPHTTPKKYILRSISRSNSLLKQKNSHSELMEFYGKRFAKAKA